MENNIVDFYEAGTSTSIQK
ncbi:hypothetical protein NPIL_645831, partial [Nephila pilipes]